LTFLTLELTFTFHLYINTNGNNDNRLKGVHLSLLRRRTQHETVYDEAKHQQAIYHLFYKAKQRLVGEKTTTNRLLLFAFLFCFRR
jgi:hypothetical protein